MPVRDRPIRSPAQREAGQAIPSRPLIVELVGPAGVGKTALLRLLGQDPRVRTGIRINRVRHFLEVVTHSVALFPAGFGLLRQGPSSLHSGLLHLVRLRTLSTVVALAMAEEAGRAIVLDEGPVFSLGRLSVFQQASQGNGRVARHWRTELNRWTTLLDAVIWIDAADPVLIERIRSRRKDHRVKNGSTDEVAEFLGRYRRAYEEILAALRASGKVQVIELNTTDVTIEAAADRVLAELERRGLPGAG